jgi:insulysin
MLFLGTDKYSDEDEYESFLSQYGGFSNAYTDMEDTNYFFSITTDAEECFSQSTEASKNRIQCTEGLYGAMDRLAQFFIAPKFDRDMVDRELRAIDSEYRNGLTNDSWRSFQLLKLASNQTHPISKFGCGNYDALMSLGQDQLLQNLQKFWTDYYKTYNLRLAVVGHGSLDVIQRMVEDTFGQIPCSDGSPRHVNTKPDQFFIRENAIYGGVTAFGTEQLGIMRHIIPITETRTIKIMFATPPLDDPAIRTSKPYRSLSHFLGHESPGSLHALLNDDGLLTSLSSGLALDTTDFSLFSLTLSLTPKGMKMKDHILDLVFQWIALLREQSFELRAAYHNELRQISDMSFRFRENDDPADFCSVSAEQLFEDGLDPARVMVASNEASDYDPIVETEFLKRLRPDNCLIHIVDSDLNGTTIDGLKWQTEKWYGAKYVEERFSPENISTWTNPPYINERLYAPALNAYIPTDLSLRCDDGSSNTATTDGVSHDDLISIPPKILIDRPNLRMWHKTDQYWRVPKAFVKTAILSPTTYRSPRSMTLNRIFQRVLNDDLNSYVYDASQAGCNYKVSCTPSGYRISLKGYSEKLPFLLDALTSRMIELINRMKAGDIKLQDRFDKGLEGLLQETKNYRLDAPSEIANYNSRLLIEQNVWCLDAYISEMEGEQAQRNPLTMLECANEAEQSLMGRLKCEAICMGNVNEEEALDVANVLDRHFLNEAQTLSDIEIPSFRSMKLPTRDEAVRLFGPEIANRPVPLIYQELAYTETEENNAVEYILQAGCELDLGYEGLAILDLITHIAYNSAFAMLRTKEQLGYIVSAHARKTAGGAWGMSVVVQSSVALPEKLEERCEAWLRTFRQELEEMSPESIAQEASAVVAQLLEKDTKMSQEVGRVWGEILNTEGLTNELSIPEFDRTKYLADELVVLEDDDVNMIRSGMPRKTSMELKQSVLDFFDRHFSASSPHRRGMSSRVYRHGSKSEFETNCKQPGVLSSYSDMRYIKQFLSTWPNVPYWFQNQNRKR